MTFFETAGQARVFLLLLYGGWIVGAAYDGLSPVRRRWPVLTPAVDAIWCLLAGAACGCALALGGEGAPRLYAMLGLCCGGAIYCLGIRRLGRRMLQAGRKILSRLPGRNKNLPGS